MRKRKYLFFIFIILLLSLMFLSCREKTSPIPDKYKSYIGVWESGNDGRLEINQDGSGKLKMRYRTMNKASIRISENRRISFTQSGIKRTFYITGEPHKRGDMWVMSLNDSQFVKVSDAANNNQPTNNDATDDSTQNNQK